MISAAFDAYFAQIYSDRWPSLCRALQNPSTTRAFHAALECPPYFLDDASVRAAMTLPFAPDAKVLDLCAAPGGKSLVLASRLGEGGTLVANERSATRRDRLRHVLDAHLPPKLRAAVRVTGHDASKWCLYETNVYDAVLLDAPCSSERHLLHQPNLLKEWTQSRSKFLAQRQYAMLASAFGALKPGGHLLYSTCSLSPLENEGVVAKLIKKKKNQVTVCAQNLEVGEARELGWIILPDTCDNAGPMYFCLLKRLA